LHRASKICLNLTKCHENVVGSPFKIKKSSAKMLTKAVKMPSFCGKMKEMEEKCKKM
jgi:hypothetical protein